jgi:hypothetical protein
MPAVAHEVIPDYHDRYTALSEPHVARRAAPRKTAPRHRWHEEKPAPRQGRSTAGRAAARPAPESSDVEELLSHFGHGNAEHMAQERAVLQSKREARRRARLRHRPFRMSAAGVAILGAPLGLLACLLWLHSSALSLSRREAKLQDRISESRFNLERTRKEIAALNASPHIASWANARHWRRATLQDFDQVTDDRVANVSDGAVPMVGE